MEVVELVAGLISAWTNADSSSAVVTAVLSFFNKALRAQKHLTSEHFVAAAISVAKQVPSGLDESSWNAVINALTLGIVSPGLPAWVAGTLSLLGALVGISTAASITDAVVPEYFLKYCRDARMAPGDFMRTALAVAKDLVLRTRLVVETGRLDALFIEMPDEPVAREALLLISGGPASVPGEGVGTRLIVSRERHLSDVASRLDAYFATMPTGPEKGRVAQLIDKFVAFRAEASAEWTGASGRHRPVNVAISGKPGAGKSFVGDLLAAGALSSVGVEFDSSAKYPVNLDRFMDGYDPARHAVLVIDEVGGVDYNDASVYEDVLRLCGEAPARAKMADPKLMKYNCNQLVSVITSNVEDYGAKLYLKEPGAFMRRFVHFRVVPLGEYSTEWGTLDAPKAAAAPQDAKIWNVEVLRARITTNAHGYLLERIGMLHSKRDIIKFGAEHADKHFKENERVAGLDVCGASLAAFLGERPQEGTEVVVDTSEELGSFNASRVLRASCGALARVGGGALEDPHAFAVQAATFVALVFADRTVAAAALGAVFLLAALARWWAFRLRVSLVSGAALPPMASRLPGWLETAQGYVASSGLDWATRVRCVAAMGALRAAIVMRSTAEELEKRELVPSIKYGAALIAAVVGAALWYYRRPAEPPLEISHQDVSDTNGDVDDSVVRAAMSDPLNWTSLYHRASEGGPSYGKRPITVAVKAPLFGRVQDNGIDGMKDAIAAAAWRFVLEGPDGTKFSQIGVQVLGSNLLCNGHALKGDEGTLKLVAADQSEGAMARRTHSYVLGGNASRLGSSDAAVIHLPSLPPVRNVLRYMETGSSMTGGVMAGAPAFVLTVGWDGSKEWVRTTVLTPPSPSLLRHVGGGNSTFWTSCSVEYVPRAGDSGAPVIARVASGWSLIGIIIGYREDKGCGFVECLSAPIVQGTIASLYGGRQLCQDVVFTSLQVRISSSDVSGRSWVHRKAFPGIVLGQAEVPRVSMRPRTQQHPLVRVPGVFEIAVRHGANKYVVPPFRPMVLPTAGGPTYIDPYDGAVGPVVEHEAIPLSRLLACVAQELDDFKTVYHDVRVLTYEEAVFGCPGVLPALDLKRAAGFWGGKDQGPKAAHVDVDTRTLKPSLRADVDSLLGSILRGEVAMMATKAQLKAELRPLEKALAGKTRSVYPGAFTSLIICRAYMGPLVNLSMARGGKRSHYAAGVNACDGAEWGEMADHLAGITADGKCRDMDVAKHDQTTPRELQVAHAVKYDELARRCGYDEQQRKVVAWCVSLNRWQLLMVDSIATIPDVGRDSGDYLTLVCNCDDITTYLRLAWLELAPPGARFEDYVRWYVMGDDLIAAVNEAAREWFTTPSIAAYLARFGVTITNGDKSVVGDADKPMEDCVFLQRKFIRVGGGKALAPLELARVYRVVMGSLGPSSVTRATVAQATALNMAGELFLHGRGAFDEFWEVVHGQHVEYDDGSSVTLRLPSYEDYEMRWSRGELKTWESGGQLTADDSQWEGPADYDDINVVCTSRRVRDSLVAAMFVSIFATCFLLLATWMADVLWCLAARAATAARRRAAARAARAADNGVVVQREAAAAADVRAGGADTALVAVAVSRAVTTAGLCVAAVAWGLRAALGVRPGARVVDCSASVPGATTDVGGELDTDVQTAVAPPRPVPQGTFEDILARWVIIDSITYTDSFTLTNGLIQSYHLLKVFIQSSAAVQRALSLKRLIIGGKIRVLISIAAPPQARGAIYAGVLPTGGSHMASINMSANQVVQLPGALINLSGPSNTMLEIPLSSPAGSINLSVDDGFHGIGSGPVLRLACVARLASGNQPSCAATLTVRMCLNEATVIQPVDEFAVAVTSARVMDCSALEATSEGAVSRPAAAAASIARAASGLPVVGAYAKTVESVASAVGSVAQLLGFGRPPDAMPALGYVTMAGGADLSCGIGVDRVPVASPDPKSSTPITISGNNWSDEDQMSIAYLSKKEALLAGSGYAGNWPTTLASGTHLFSLPVCPSVMDAGSGGGVAFVPHPVMMIGQFAVRWRGTCVVRIMAFGGSLDSGRLRVFWVPGRGNPTGVLGPTQFHGATLDLGGGSAEVTIRVPMATGSPMLRLPHGFDFNPFTQYSTAPVSYCNGQVHCHVENPLVTGRSPDSVQVVAMVSWEDLEFSGFSTGFALSVVPTSAIVRENDAGEVDVPGVGPPATDASSYPLVHLRPALSPYWQVGLFRLNSPLTHISSYTFPTPIILADGAYPGLTNLNHPYFTRSWPTQLDYVFRSYSLYRGSTRYRVVREASGTAALGPYTHGWLAVASAGEWTSDWTYGRGGAWTTAIGSDLAVRGSMDPLYWFTNVLIQRPWLAAVSRFLTRPDALMGIKVPWDWSWPWRLCVATGVYGLPANGVAASTTSHVTFCVAEEADSSQNPSTYTLYQAFGEDIVFHGFTCMPVWASGVSAWPLT